MNINYVEHNTQSKLVRETFDKGNPVRVPVTIYADSRNYLALPELNTEGITLGQYLKDPGLMMEVQIKTREWIRHNILSDDGVGYPDSWDIIVDCQNYLEMAWLGGQISDAAEPHCPPFLSNENKETIFKSKLPDPWQGIHQQVMEYYNYFMEQKKSYTYKGIPIGCVSLPFNMTGTDGPFTLACGIRGTQEFLYDIIDDPGYAFKLMDYLTEAIIGRIRAVRKFLGEDEKGNYCGIADDSIVILSPEIYKEFVLPFHKKIYNELSESDAYRTIHLCGDAQRFFPVIQKELNVMQFDTGFPVDFARLYNELDPETVIMGGPPVDLLLNGTPDQIDKCVKDILQSGVMQKSKKFILREANALSPGTPLENVNQIYLSALKYGVYNY